MYSTTPNPSDRVYRVGWPGKWRTSKSGWPPCKWFSSRWKISFWLEPSSALSCPCQRIHRSLAFPRKLLETNFSFCSLPSKLAELVYRRCWHQRWSSYWRLWIPLLDVHDLWQKEVDFLSNRTGIIKIKQSVPNTVCAALSISVLPSRCPTWAQYFLTPWILSSGRHLPHWFPCPTIGVELGWVYIKIMTINQQQFSWIS